MKRVTCFCIMFVFFVTLMISPALALNSSICTETTAKVAYIPNVDSKGLKLNNTMADGNQYVQPDVSTTIRQDGRQISVILDSPSQKIQVAGEIEARSENSNIIFYKGRTLSPEFSVVYLAYEKELLHSNLYFTDGRTAESLLRIYLKHEAGDAVDYLIAEVFNVGLNYDSPTVAELPADNLLAAWAAREFSEVDTQSGPDPLMVSVNSASPSTKYWYCSKTFNDCGEDQTHTIRWKTYVDPVDVIKGQEARQIYKLTVYQKSMTFTENTNSNSNSASYLIIDKLSLSQTSVPYTAWRSTEIDGSVHKALFAGELSADISVNLGLLSASLSFPISFTESGTVDINGTYNSYTNSQSQYTRSIKTEMGNPFSLTQVGHYFEVTSYLKDYGNATRSAASLNARWDVEILNNGNLTYCNHTCSHNTTLAIVA